MQPQNLYSSPGPRFAILRVIGFVHLGQFGVEATNVSTPDKAKRNLVVELPMPDSASRVHAAL
jgi:hypothetical protein